MTARPRAHELQSRVRIPRPVQDRGIMNHEAESDPQDLFSTDAAGLAEASRPTVIRLHDGDRLDLTIHPVRKTIAGAELRMLAYNDSIPGSTLHVDQGAEITVQVRNDGDTETTAHWHGLRLENRYDGVPHETQTAHPHRRHVQLQAPVPRRRLLLVPPARARRLRAGDGPVRHHRRRACRRIVLAPGRPVRHPHPGRPARAKTDTSRRSAVPGRPTPRWAASATSC